MNSGIFSSYVPDWKKNRLKHYGDLEFLRNYYYSSAPPNLKYAFYRRLNWMNQYIHENDIVIEVGCGIGVTKDYIKKGHLMLTDHTNVPWVDMRVDAHQLPFVDSSVDIIIANNAIHHFSHPRIFLREAARVLRKGGFILVQEFNLSWISFFILHALRLEGYSFLIDVFDEGEDCCDGDGIWSANCAIPRLLFDDKKKFRQKVPEFTIVHDSYADCITFILSGGVSGRTLCIPFHWNILRTFTAIDGFLVAIAPRIFAIQRRLVLKNSTKV